MRIIFDLDGVLRELNTYLNTKFDVPYPETWFWKHKDKDIFDWIKEDRYLPLIYSPPTDLYWIAKNAFENIEIWSNQPEIWKPYTKLWLDLHFKERGVNYEIKYLDNAQKRTLLDNTPDAWLLEDNPLFTSWERILLVDKPYNRHIVDATRIRNLEDLDGWIWKMLKHCEDKNENI